MFVHGRPNVETSQVLLLPSVLRQVQEKLPRSAVNSPFFRAGETSHTHTQIYYHPDMCLNHTQASIECCDMHLQRHHINIQASKIKQHCIHTNTTHKCSPPLTQHTRTRTRTRTHIAYITAHTYTHTMHPLPHTHTCTHTHKKHPLPHRHTLTRRLGWAPL